MTIVLLELPKCYQYRNYLIEPLTPHVLLTGMYLHRHITAIIPALNEAPSIACVIDALLKLRVCTKCQRYVQPVHSSNVSRLCCTTAELLTIPLVDQIIVCDNGSTDDTAKVAAASGAVVVHEPEQGYGAACLAALAAPVDKDVVVFVDGDHSVVASELPVLLDPLYQGADLVIGSRTADLTERGALSVPQRFGNRLASFLIRRLWHADVTDLGPFRATTQATLDVLQMQDRRFGWTVEMQVRALQEAMVVVEVPVSTLRRIGQSKISGTVRGVLGAGYGILSMILRLYRAGIDKRHNTYALARRG